MNRRSLVVNGLSVSRIPLSAAVLGFGLAQSFDLNRATVTIVAIIFFTDIADGALARRWGVTSRLGYLLDGLGDRASYLAVLLLIAEEVRLGGVAVFILIFRDVALYAARSFFSDWAAAIDETRTLTKVYAWLFRIGLGGGLVAYYGRIYGFLRPEPLEMLTSAVRAYFLFFVIFSCATLFALIRSYIGSTSDRA